MRKTSLNIAAGLSLASILLIMSVATAQTPELSPETSPSPSPAVSVSAVDEAAAALEQNRADLEAKQQEIKDLNGQITKLRSQHATTANEAAIIANQLSRLELGLKKAQLELKRTQLNIKAVERDRYKTADTVKSLSETIAARRAGLKEIIRLLYSREQTPLSRIFLQSGTLSGLLMERQQIKELQDKSMALVLELRQREGELKEQQQRLEEQAADLTHLAGLQSAQQADLNAQQQEQAVFLKAKRAEQVKFEQKIVEAEQARREIEQDVFTLKNAGVKLSLTQATDMAKLASKLTGVRAALLLGVLKVETNVGTNIGGGTFPDDMHPGSRDAFLRIAKKLGLDPYRTPISARPRSYQGWGGAMGPAQIMPATWETIEPRLVQLLGKALPNPYDMTDAFVATAVFLADRGATSRTGEYEAVNRYLAGPNWQRFTWYGDRVLAVAAEYEKTGL